MKAEWTTDYPTEPGYYWIRNWEKLDPLPVVVVVTPLLNFYQCGSEHMCNQAQAYAAGAEWYGPIQPPAEQTEPPDGELLDAARRYLGPLEPQQPVGRDKPQVSVLDQLRGMFGDQVIDAGLNDGSIVAYDLAEKEPECHCDYAAYDGEGFTCDYHRLQQEGAEK